MAATASRSMRRTAAIIAAPWSRAIVSSAARSAGGMRCQVSALTTVAPSAGPHLRSDIQPVKGNH